MSDPVKAIANRIRRRCADFATMTLSHATSDPWQSLLFDGARHRIALNVNGRIDDALDAMREIDTGEFLIPGHLVAEIRVANIERGAEDALITLDALTIEN